MPTYDIGGTGPIKKTSDDPLDVARMMVRLRSGVRGLDDVLYGYSKGDERVDLTVQDLAALVQEVEQLREQVTDYQYAVKRPDGRILRFDMDVDPEREARSFVREGQRLGAKFALIRRTLGEWTEVPA